MKIVTENSESLAAELDCLPRDGNKQPIQAKIVNQDGQLLCAGNVDFFYSAEKSPELSHGTFWPNQWPTLIKFEELEDTLVLQTAGKQKFEILHLDKCRAGGRHYHFRFKA
jgi:hypothetical protein